jgi:glycosidase
MDPGNLLYKRRVTKSLGLRKWYALWALVAGLASLTQISQAQDFKKRVIYQIVTDRFVNGDTTNDNPPQSAGLFDPTKTNWQLYWGGDLAGIQQRINYLSGMGITAVWISPPLDNINVSIPDSNGNPMAPYHGYSTHDFKRIEEHFGDIHNTWAAFDSLVSAAHAAAINIIVDLAANDSNPAGAGEYGSLYDTGNFLAACNNDPNGYFHHNPPIGDFNDRYQLQYDTLEGLCDLNQENTAVDAYLKSAVAQLQQHGTDAFRVDAVKHVTWGWEYSLVNSIFANAPSFIFGEWYGFTPGDPLYHDAYKFANKSGMSLLDYGVATAVRDVFGSNSSFQEIDGTLGAENSNFASPNDLVTFVDNHDLPRLLSFNNNTNRLNEALAFVLTCRGIPIVYYGDEQYLHNDTNGGGDPYNRVWMSSFNQSTTAYRLIQKLAALRQNNNALAYGTSRQRWINNDVYIFERQFFNDTALIAINKNDTTSYAIGGLYTALPPGTYSDYLGGLLGGLNIKVDSGSGSSDPVEQFSLPPHSVAVWQAASAASGPEVGSIGPTVGQPGTLVTIAGKGFGSAAGSVLFGSAAATIAFWSDSAANFTVPKMPGGVYQVQLKTASGNLANAIPFTVLTANVVPVTFTVSNAATSWGQNVFLTGSTVELGNWSTTWDGAIGPMLNPSYPAWFINASMPAGQAIQFKFIKIDQNGNVTWEGGANHTYTVPPSRTGFVNVTWQN